MQKPYENRGVKNALITTIGAGAAACVLLVVALPVYGGTFQLYTVRGFVESLIERGIVPESMASKARDIAAAVSIVEDLEKRTTSYSEYVTVSVSQLIENSQRTYAAGSDIEGLVLLATNTHTEDVYPSAVRGCQVVYRIYKDGVLEYDRALSSRCTTEERVTYRLAPGQTRMFEIDHPANVHTLAPGTYTFVLEYPGYGSGSREVTVQ